VIKSAFIWNPAGADRDLAQVGQDLKAGRYHEARALVAATRDDFELRAHRSLVLAAVSAGLDVAERWIAEEPSNPDALLIYARTAVARALRAADTNDERAGDLAALAQRACLVSADADPRDPTPWAGLLALARLGHAKAPAPDGVTAEGPWDLFDEARARDPLNREVHHRMLACFFARYGGSHDAMWETARWISLSTPPDCALQVLPLTAYVEHYRALREDPVRGPYADRQWAEQHALFTSMHVFDGWFRKAQDDPMVPVADFSVLAHALFMGDRLWEAAKVFRAMGPYATTHPWSLFGDPAEQLARARQRCRVRAP
jgi:hypothetical protein